MIGWLVKSEAMLRSIFVNRPEIRFHHLFAFGREFRLHIRACFVSFLLKQASKQQASDNQNVLFRKAVYVIRNAFLPERKKAFLNIKIDATFVSCWPLVNALGSSFRRSGIEYQPWREIDGCFW